MIEVDWIAEDINKLIRMYPYLSNEDLTKILHRSVSSIQHKATRLKLKKDKEVNSIIRGKSREGEKCCNWKGGRKISPKGYILILKKGHPLADSRGYIFEHRLVMCEYLEKIIDPKLIVHHINGIKTDNQIENLKLMTNAEHTILHHKGTKMSEEAKRNMSNVAKNRRKKVISI